MGVVTLEPAPEARTPAGERTASLTRRVEDAGDEDVAVADLMAAVAHRSARADGCVQRSHRAPAARRRLPRVPAAPEQAVLAARRAQLAGQGK